MQTISTEKNEIKLWTDNVPVEKAALEQLKNTANLDIIFKHIAVMPDVHYGKGATIGSVVCTTKAVIPAAVGVDIGCGMIACKTTLQACDLPDNLKKLRNTIEDKIPVGFNGWKEIPNQVNKTWDVLKSEFEEIKSKYKHLDKTNNVNHLGTLGGGNHFIEICIDQDNQVWIMIHSGSRGVGNAIGNTFIELAKKDAYLNNKNLPDKDLAYLEEGSSYFGDYIQSVNWAQNFAKLNRQIMLNFVIEAMKDCISKSFSVSQQVINCHHNYVQKEIHFNTEVYCTRKGAVSAKKDELGIIPGSMGAKSYITKGKGQPLSFNSSSHGAGRIMSRNAAKKIFTEKDQELATTGVECKKDASVIDEIPLAYKNIDDVMKSQEDLVEVLYTLKQVLCVKG